MIMMPQIVSFAFTLNEEEKISLCPNLKVELLFIVSSSPYDIITSFSYSPFLFICYNILHWPKMASLSFLALENP